MVEDDKQYDLSAEKAEVQRLYCLRTSGSARRTEVGLEQRLHRDWEELEQREVPFSFMGHTMLTAFQDVRQQHLHVTCT
jgi:hypothetical protein